MFDAKNVAVEILANIGEANNVESVFNCMTRLRITLSNVDLVNVDNIKKIAGVSGVVLDGNQLQVIIGPGKVVQVYNEFNAIYETTPKVTSSVSTDKAKVLKEQINKKNSTVFKIFLKRLANIFVPIIPAFIGCGLILGLFNVINKSVPIEYFGGMSFDKTTIGALMKLIGMAIPFGLSIFTGINTSKEFKGTPIFGGVLAAILTMPDLNNVIIFGENAVAGRGGIIAVLFVVIFAAYLENWMRKIIPSAFDLFLTPVVVILVSSVLAIFVLQPLGGFISDGLATLVKVSITHGSAALGFAMGFGFLPLVMTGLHQGLIPIHAELIKTTGMTELLPILAMGGAGQVGAVLAVLIKTKNEKLKKIIKSSLLVGFLGVGEPLIYGVTLPLFRPFIGACIGGGVGGAIAAIFHLGASGIGLSGLPLTLMIDNGMGLYLCALFGAYVGGFIATWIIGFDDSLLEE